MNIHDKRKLRNYFLKRNGKCDQSFYERVMRPPQQTQMVHETFYFEPVYPAWDDP